MIEKTYILTDSQVKQIRADALDEFAQAFKDYVYTEKLRGNNPYWTVAIEKITEQLKSQKT